MALQRLKGLSLAQKKVLVESVGNVSDLFQGKARFGCEGFPDRFSAFHDWKAVDRDLERARELGAEIVPIKDPSYPSLLRHTPDPPMVLYRKGPLEMSKDTLAIVGSRRASFESMNLAEKIARTLSSLGVTIVSGLARGVDASAHNGALLERGKTVGVLGCGIDVCYPAENRGLSEKVAAEGMILTEYAPGEMPLQHHFPERNRIIAGLCKGVLVVEASKKSGSLITARLGLEYGREVMAIPGSVFNEEYRGANNLIKHGARLIQSIEDITTTCFPGLLHEAKPIALNNEETHIYGIIGLERIHVDEVVEKSNMETKSVMAILTALEMKGAIRGVPGGFYVRQ